MANIKSAKKRILLNEKSRLKNKHVTTQLKTYLRRTNEAISERAENAQELLKFTLKLIDKATGKLLPKKNGGRKKSKLMKAYTESLKSPAPAKETKSKTNKSTKSGAGAKKANASTTSKVAKPAKKAVKADKAETKTAAAKPKAKAKTDAASKKTEKPSTKKPAE